MAADEADDLGARPHWPSSGAMSAGRPRAGRPPAGKLRADGRLDLGLAVARRERFEDGAAQSRLQPLGPSLADRVETAGPSRRPRATTVPPPARVSRMPRSASAAYALRDGVQVHAPERRSLTDRRQAVARAQLAGGDAAQDLAAIRS